MENVLEGAIRTIRDEMLAKSPDEYCTCQQCRDDVLTYALNQVRPRYVTGTRPLGTTLTLVELAQEQMRAALTVAVLEGLRRVAARPRHGPEKRVSGKLPGPG